MVVKIINYWRETVIITVITSEYTVPTVVTNRKLRCRPLLDNDHIQIRYCRVAIMPATSIFRILAGHNNKRGWLAEARLRAAVTVDFLSAKDPAAGAKRPLSISAAQMAAPGMLQHSMAHVISNIFWACQ